MDELRAARELTPGHAPDGVTAWRYWHVTAAGILRSVSHSRFVWRPGQPLRAVCVTGGHDPPLAGCGCGIYGARDLATLRRRRMCLDPVPLVVGEVRLWGRVVADEGSYRGRFAYPRRLLLVDGTGDEEMSVADDLEAYGVPVGTIPLAAAVDDVTARLIAFQEMSAGWPR